MSLKSITTLAIAISFASCQGGISAEPPKTETGSQLSTKGFQFKLPGGYGIEDVIDKGAPVVGIVALSGLIGKYRHQLSGPLPILQNPRICPNWGSFLSVGLIATGIGLVYSDTLNKKLPILESIGFTLYTTGAIAPYLIPKTPSHLKFAATLTMPIVMLWMLITTVDRDKGFQAYSLLNR